MIKLEMVDRFGHVISYYIHDPICPVLVDKWGRPIISFGGVFRAFRRPSLSDPQYKMVMDAFIMRPSPGLFIYWIEMPDTPAYKHSFKLYAEALYLMTGKRLTGISVQEKS